MKNLKLYLKTLWAALMRRPVIANVKYEDGAILALAPGQRVIISGCTFNIKPSSDDAPVTVIHGGAIKERLEELMDDGAKDHTTLAGLMVEGGMAPSLRDARRLIQQIWPSPQTR